MVRDDAWLALALDAPETLTPARRAELQALAAERVARLEAGLAELRSALERPGGDSSYRSPEDGARPRRARALELAALLTTERHALRSEDLDDPARLFEWLRTQPSYLDHWTGPLDAMREDFHRMVTDGRPDLGHLLRGDDDEDESDEEDRNHALDTEQVDHWKLVAWASDGHGYVFWDPTSTGELRLLRVDNREPEVVLRDWTRPEDYLIERALPDAAALVWASLPGGRDGRLARSARAKADGAPVPERSRGRWPALVAITVVIAAFVLVLRTCLDGP